ncbi:MAG TPA: hypothetical protein VE860_14110 [Chthoniobacterales bacterium]|jgi:hypothetical protein|nr:hypothetical protein [Chthoniobacterales bacterium]
MLAKYHVQFSIPLEHRRLVNDFRTDDPIECEEFVADLLLRGYKINSISHDGVPLSRSEFDSAVLLAAKTAIAKLLTTALDLDEAEMRHRFSALFNKK